MILYDWAKVVMSRSEPIEGRMIEKRRVSCDMCSNPGKSDTIHHSSCLSHLKIDPKLTRGQENTSQIMYVYVCNRFSTDSGGHF